MISVALSVVTESFEEIGEFFSFGDGGEFDETDPHPAAWQEPFAYRSYRSAQSMAAKMVERQTLTSADRVTFLGFGRTGSTIQDGLLGPRTVSGHSIDSWTKNRGQLQEIADTVGRRKVDALIISIGINDLGFSSLVKNSIRYKSGERRKKLIKQGKSDLQTKFPGYFRALRDEIETTVKPQRVFITEYPVEIFKEIADGGEACGILGTDLPTGGWFNLSKADATGLGELGVLLNKMIREHALEFGWVAVEGIVEGFEGHGYCSAEPFYVSAEESCLNQGDFEGMLHPNANGNAVARDCLVRALERDLLGPGHRWLEPVLHTMMQTSK